MLNGRETADITLLKVGHCIHPEAMVLNDASWKPCQFPSIVAVIKLPKDGYMLFDTGYAQRFNSVTNKFPQRLYRFLTPMHLHPQDELLVQLTALNIDISDIKYIFISHFHADHIAGLKDFPSAKYICSKHAYESFVCRSGLNALIKGYLKELLPNDFEKRVIFIEHLKYSLLPKSFYPFTTAYDVFEDGGCFAIDLPGHAFGHIGLLTPTSMGSQFLIGDACWSERSFKEKVKPNRIASIIMSNYEHYLNTLSDISILHDKNKSVDIIPSHCITTFNRFNNV